MISLYPHGGGLLFRKTVGLTVPEAVEAYLTRRTRLVARVALIAANTTAGTCELRNLRLQQLTQHARMGVAAAGEPLQSTS